MNVQGDEEVKTGLLAKDEEKGLKYPLWPVLSLMLVTVLSNQTFSGINAVLALYFHDVSRTRPFFFHFFFLDSNAKSLDFFVWRPKVTDGFVCSGWSSMIMPPRLSIRVTSSSSLPLLHWVGF